MKNKMPVFIALIFSLISFSLAGAEVIILPEVSFDIKTSDALAKIEDTLLNPESFLKRYRPGGAKIKNMSVDAAQFQFTATKKVLIISAIYGGVAHSYLLELL